ncbi:MAG: hypothetical protein IKD46_06365 [Lentisphaeria bacterium]|nr:hypothetical protein [Lentisphaeria bacterium]
MEKVLSFPPCTPSILFQNFLCSLFHFALHAKMKKRDIRFENEEVQKGNARICLHSGKVERLHGNTGGFYAHGLQGSGGSGAKRLPTACPRACHGVAQRRRVLPASKAKSTTKLLKINRC